MKTYYLLFLFWWALASFTGNGQPPAADKSTCLTFSNPDSANLGWDIHYDPISIIDTSGCKAAFSAELDSLNKDPNTFRFYDQSSGSPNYWKWIFDDGFVSEQQNPVHQFVSPGEHKVCLLIRKTDTSVTVCTDSTCHIIKTADYFNLGGHLFAGRYPINNPTNNGDTGITYLYRVDNNKILPVDTNLFTYLGYFTFPSVLKGSYIIKAELAPGSPNFNNYLPVYYLQALHWKEASHFTISDSSYFMADIYMTPFTDSLSGNGSIRGYVVKGSNLDRAEIIPHAEVLLMNEKKEILSFTFTDPSGHFAFTGLPFRNYLLNVEVTGKYSRTIAVSLNGSQPVLDSIKLEVFDYDVSGFNEIRENQNIIIGKIFPNPGFDEIQVPVYIRYPMTLKTEIITLSGQHMPADQKILTEGENMIRLTVKDLREGIYFLIISSGNDNFLNIQKFIKF